MIARMKAYIAAGASILAVVFYAMFQKKRADRAAEALEREEAAREYEQAGSEALIGGLTREERAKNEKVDTVKRDHFS